MGLHLTSCFILYHLLLLNAVQCTKGESGDFETTLVAEFMTLCPHSEICTNSSDNVGNRTDFIPGGFTPCCGACLCHNCAKDCCPGVYTTPITEEEKEGIKHGIVQCVYPQVRVFNISKFNVDPVEMVVRCPDRYMDKIIKSKCEREYDEHDLSADLNTLKYFIPTSVSNGRSVFKNSYCAKCHGIEDADMINWKVQLVCSLKADITPHIERLEDITKQLEYDFCNIIFEPNHNAINFSPTYCEFGISRCNQTGEWITYDSFLEQACLSYTAIYRKQYKNVHCALCNGHKTDDVLELCEAVFPGSITNIFSFLAVLDFRDLEKSSSYDNGRICPRGHVYDKYQSKCLQLMCPKSYYLSGDECRALIGYEGFYGSTISLDITFRVLSKNGLIYPLSIWDYISTEYVIQDVKNKLHFPHPTEIAMNFNLCNFRSFIKLSKSINDTLYEMKQKNLSSVNEYVKFVGFKVQVTVDNFVDLRKVIDYIASTFTSSNTLFNDLHVVYQDTDDNDFTATNDTVISDIDTDILLSTLNISRYEEGMLLISFEGSNDQGVIPRTREASDDKCLSSVFVFPTGVCPVVSLPFANASLAEYVPGIGIVIMEKTVNFYRWFLSDDSQHVFICWEDYLRNTEYLQNDQNSENGVSGIGELTIVVLSLSLVSLAITFGVYCLLPSLRNLPGLNNMGLVISLFVSHLLILINSLTAVDNIGLCRAIGLVLHWTLLCNFSWMFVCTYHMMKVFVAITDHVSSNRRNKQFFKYVLFTITTSTCLVLIQILASFLRTETIGYGGRPCYIVKPESILYYVAIPAGIVVIVNIAMFGFVVYRVSSLPEIEKGSSNHDRNNLTIFVKLSTITGMTWIFGFLYQLTEFDLFAYLFVILTAGQGVFIMISFVLNERVFRKLCVVVGRRNYAPSTAQTGLTHTEKSNGENENPSKCSNETHPAGSHG